jgi:hypothetical protein
LWQFGYVHGREFHAYTGREPVGDTMPDTTIPNCVERCPHRQSVSGACGHDLEDALVREFLDNPGQGCPFSPE